MTSATVRSDRRLKRALHEAARRKLGPEASDQAINAQARQWHERRRRGEAPPETPVQRMLRVSESTQMVQELRRRAVRCSCSAPPS